MSDTSLRFNFEKGRDTASPAMRSIANTATRTGTQIRLASVLSTAAMASLIAVAGGLGAQAIALGAALAPLIGLLGLIPALAVGAAAGLAPLLIGFKNVFAALQTSKGAASAVDQVAAAEHRVQQAQRAALDAQQSLNEARAQATRNLQDMDRELAKAALDERSAVLAVKEAENNLRQVRASGGSRDDREAAQIAYQQAVISLSEIRERNADLAKTEADRAAKGVEGSDEVQQALQKQADALYEVQQAQDALAKAQSGSGGVDKAAEAYAKLSAEGKALVDVLRTIPAAWGGVAQAVQGSLLAGVAGDVQNLSNVWLVNLQGRLVELGSAWNEGFRGILQLAASQPFVDDLNAALGNMAVFGRSLSASFSPFLKGFMDWTVVGSTFLPQIGAWIQSIGDRFAAWSASARETGRAHDWIQNALTTLSQTWEVLKNIGSIIAGVFRAGSGGPDWLPSLIAGTQRLEDWVNSPAGQGKLAGVFETLRDVAGMAYGVLIQIGPVLLGMLSPTGTLSDTVSVFGVVIKFVADHLGTFVKLLPIIIGAFVAWKALQSAAVVVDMVRIPLLIAQVVSNIALAVALRAHTAAMRSATASQWALNVAEEANPIGLIILAIIAFIAIIILLIKYHKQIGEFFVMVWGHIWDFLKGIGAWFAGPFVDFFVNAWHWIVGKFEDGVAWVKGWIDRFLAPIMAIKDHIQQVGIWQTLQDGFKAAVNFIIGLWNKLDFSLGPWQIPDWVPFVGGKQFYIPDIFPDIPFLASGGRVVQEGMAYIHRGEEVVPAAQVERGGGGGGPMVLEFHSDGTRAGDLLVELMRHAVRVRGGNVQVALGR